MPDFTPERLRERAARIDFTNERSGAFDPDDLFTADALRAFASVVSVLGIAHSRMRWLRVTEGRGVWTAHIYGAPVGEGDTPLAALLSLAAALDAGRGTDG
jgi:hypothetical protein